MSKPNKQQVWLSNLEADLREVFGLYDLELYKDDGLWLRKSPYQDSFIIQVIPFANHTPWDRDARGAKSGTVVKAWEEARSK